MENINKSTLIDYLYGELDEADMERVRQQLKASPAAKAELERLLATRHKLTQLEDESVHEPLVFAGIVPKGQSAAWKKWTAVAAILIGGLLAAALLQVRISYRDQELAIRFGESKPAIQNSIPEKVQTLALENTETKGSMARIAPTDSLSDSLMLMRIVALERKLQSQIRAMRQRQLTSPAGQTGLTTEQIADLISDLQQENYETMQQLMATTGQQQQLYSQQMLTQLTDYLASQRKEDLQKIDAVLNTIVQTTDEKQQQTDYVLTQVISKLNESEKGPKEKSQ